MPTAPTTPSPNLTVEAIVAIETPREYRLHPRDRVVAYTAESAGTRQIFTLSLRGGFPAQLTASEKAMFCAFRDEIPGTGAKKALEYLDKASKSLPDFRRAVMDRDEKLLCGVFGFTKKTATKIVDALKGKLEDVRVPGAPHLQPAGASVPATGSWGQALNALEALGYKFSDARTALQALAEEHGGKDVPTEQLVRQALKRL